MFFCGTEEEDLEKQMLFQDPWQTVDCTQPAKGYGKFRPAEGGFWLN